MEKQFFLYAVSFLKDGVQRVVVLHAIDEQDARHMIREGYGRAQVSNVERIDDLRIGMMRQVYEHKV